MTAAPCTTPTCETPTETYLCHQCVSDLQAWIDKIPDLYVELDVTIARLDKVTKQQGGGGGKAGSKAPLNLDALELKVNLESVKFDAAHYANDENAALIAWTIQDWVTKAELAVSGPVEPRIDHEANKRRVRDIAEPMPTRTLVPWLKANAGITVTSRNIRDWVYLKKLRAIDRKPQPTYYPHEVLAVWHETRR